MTGPIDFAAPDAPEDDGLTLEATDVRNAERLVELHGSDLRFVGTWGGKWLAYDGKRWTLDEKAAVMFCAKDVARIIAEESETELAAARAALDSLIPAGVKDVKAAKKAGIDTDAAEARVKRAETMKRWAQVSQMDPRLHAMVNVAKSALAITHTELDSDPMLFNCANGTLDLRTGTLRPHRREDLCTKMSPVAYDPHASRERWDQFMREVCVNDEELIAFHKSFLGYCLTGDVREHVFAFWYGTGGNGKSVLANVIMHIMGEYAVKTMPDIAFRSEKSEKHETEIAHLHGRRLAFSNESKAGRVLDDGRIKDLTGGDQITARRMREDPWSFDPTHKLVLFGQHKPTLRTVDGGLKRRTKLVPFAAKFEGDAIDRGLEGKLLAEAPAILAWLVEGCSKWQRWGLPACKAIDAATSEYFAQEDTIGQFFDGECALAPDAKITRKELRDHYAAWCDDGKPLPDKAFSQAVRDRGGVECRVRGAAGPRRGWRGIRLLTDSEKTDRENAVADAAPTAEQETMPFAEVAQ